MKLHLGVIDYPHGNDGSITTGDLAEILESKYHPMEIYYEEHQNEIAKDLADSVAGAIESLMLGAPPSLDPFGEANTNIANGFKRFIAEGELEKLGYPGVPTQAALDGVNHRLKIKRGPRRPSLIDTSQYVDSAVAWVE